MGKNGGNQVSIIPFRISNEKKKEKERLPLSWVLRVSLRIKVRSTRNRTCEPLPPPISSSSPHLHSGPTFLSIDSGTNRLSSSTSTRADKEVESECKKKCSYFNVAVQKSFFFLSLTGFDRLKGEKLTQGDEREKDRKRGTGGSRVPSYVCVHFTFTTTMPTVLFPISLSPSNYLSFFFFLYFSTLAFNQTPS